MTRVRFARFAPLPSVICLFLVSSLQAQLAPEESAKKLKPADGLEATLWASEPMLVNPTTIDVDSRGRVWVTEGLNYRLTRGGNRQFKRIEGADKIKILEDTDNDGKADKVTVFAENIFPVPMGIAIEEHWSKEGKYEGAKVFVGNSPDLLVLEDTDGDDVADKRYPLLTGFGGIDSDHGVHGMVLGPDGKLYFTHGDGCCSVQQDHSERQQNFDVIDKSGRRVSTDQLGTVLRCNRDGTQFEILATRLRNDYECALDSFGNVFASDNDDDGNRGSRVVWIMDGGVYGYRTPGSRLHWGEDVAGNIPKLAGTGNGSPCGVMVYEGEALPELYRGALLEAEAGPRVINAFPLKRQGAGFRTEQHVMLSSDDDWFRPVDVCAAPDGSLMVADWYDGGVGGHAFRDQTTGRIYRIANKGGNHDAVRFDFTKPEGIAAALMSPNIAARDVAARWMIERGPTSDEAQQSANQVSQMKPLERAMARMLWLSTLTKDTRILDSIRNELKSRGATARNMPAPVREQLCRMLGRDNSRLGATPADGRFPPTRGELEYASLAGMTEDPDESVRREIILSLRDVPTSIAGETLKKLAKNWDGRDRWYLEALGLALRHREPEFIKSLFEGSLYGDPIADEASRNSKVALPPYFPTDRNEAYLKPGDELPPANALSKTLGLMWELHRVESLPLLAKLMPSLHAPELQQAADDIIAFIDDPSGAPIVADMIAQLNDNARKTRAMGSLARKLEGPWRGAAQNDDVVQLIQSSLGKNELRNSAITLAAATGDARYTEPLTKLIDDANAASEIRVAALEGLARLNRERATEISIAQIGAARTSQKNSPLAEAAVRVMALMGAPSEKLGELTTADNLPLPLRREALRGLLQRRDAIEQVLAMARENKIPSDLRLEAATLLRAHPDRGVRDQALELFPIKSKDGKPLPSTGELMRRNGDAEKGKQVFFAADRESGAGKTACASCHRVQGQGQWIGPDLSTIGTKYGKAELLNSILNPSAAISYTFRSQVVATNDGRVVTGLPVEETPQSLVLKTAEGERITVDKNAIDERRDSDISLMPEGLIENLSEDELVDLLAYLSTLTKPVSVVGDVHVVGPLSASDQAGDLAKPARPDQPLDDHGTKREWQRVAANAEGVLKMQPAGDGGMMLHVPVRSPAAQKARLVIDSDGVDAVWLGGKLVSGRKGVRDVELELPAGDADLNIRVWAKGNQGVVLTFVSDQPVSFESSPVKP